VTLACAGGFLDVVKILLSNGADINLGQSTPLMEASQEGHIELVQFLIENGTILCFVFAVNLMQFFYFFKKVQMWFKQLELEIQVIENISIDYMNDCFVKISIGLCL
jgi:ankyrin repeat protein